MLIIFGLLAGLLFGLFTNIALPASLVPYLAVFTLVGIEALTGSWNGIREGDFDPVRFLVEFAVNTAAAVLLTALGNQMKYDFSMIVSFVFAYRIFKNINFITRKLYLDMKKRRKRAASRPRGEGEARKP